MSLGTTIALACAAALPGPPDASAIPPGDSDVALELEWSLPMVEPMGFLTGKLTGWPERLLVLRVEGFGVVHDLVIDPTDPWIRPGTEISLQDRYLWPPAPGAHEVVASLVDVEREDVLFSQSFTLEVPAYSEEQMHEALDGARVYLSGAAHSIRNSWSSYVDRLARHHAGEDWVKKEDLERHAADYRDAIAAEFVCRVDFWNAVASVHEAAQRPAAVRKALDLAEEIYQKERQRRIRTPHGPERILGQTSEMFTWVPRHYRGNVDYYARREELEPAIEWYQRLIDSYYHESERTDLSEAERRGARDEVAVAHREMAHLTIMLRGDWEAYRREMEQFLIHVSDFRRATPAWGYGGCSSSR